MPVRAFISLLALTCAAAATPMDNSWDLSSVAGQPVTVQSNGASAFSGASDSARSYLRTNKSDFNAASFVAEISVTVNNGSGTGCAFVGMGAGTAFSGFYQEPQTAPSNYLRLAPSDFGSGYLTFNDNSVSTSITSSGPGNGTHRVRLIWDAATRRLQTDVDANSSSGVFVRDYGRVNYSSGTGFAAGNTRLFVGGAAGVSFGPLSVRPATTNDLALIDSSSTRWMTAIGGGVKLSQLTIPGTHDSAARYENWSGTAKCQTLSIAEQLNAGIRYLDARCRHIGDSFSMHHGEVYQNIRFGEVLQQVYDFLGANPGETVMMVVKEEHTADGNTRSFEATFDAYTAANPGRWWLGTSIPTFDEARGKIVLVRRFGANVAKGINATYWPDNTNFSANNLVVEDHYVVDDYDWKWNFVTAGLNAAAADTNSGILHLTHSSGYDPQLFGIPNIGYVADSMNPRINSWFTDVKPGHYGCLIMDFADTSRPWLVARSNFVRPGPIPDGVYQVLAKHSGSSLDVTGASADPGVPVQQWQWGGGNNQRWTFTNLGDGFYRISALHSGQCLDVEGSSTSNGGRVLQYLNTGNANQQWSIAANGDSSFRFTNRHSGLVLDVEAASGANGAKVEQWSWNGGDNQRWLLQPVNRAPVFTPPARLYGFAGGSVSGSLAASDPDPGHSPVRFAKAGAPSWLNVSPDGAISGTIPAGVAGDLSVTVLADDPLGAVSSATLNLTILEDPVWTNPAGGDWAQSSNWRYGLVGGAANGPRADFSTLDLTSNATVTLTGPVSLNHLEFADATPSHDWTLTGSPTLTLVGPTTPEISVANQTTTIGTVLAGNQGLLKTGVGTLALSRANNLTGSVTISQGIVRMSTNTSLGSGAISLCDATTGASDVAWFFQGGGTPSNPVTVTNQGTGTVTLGSHSSGTYTEPSSPLTLNRPVTLHDGTGDRTSFLGKITGPVGTLTLTGPRVTFFNGTNDFTGNVVVADGTVYQNDAAGAIPDATGFTLNGSSARFRLNNNSETIGALDGSGIVDNVVGSGNTLTVGGGNSSGAFAGVLTNGSGVLNLAKTGGGTQILSGASSHTGTTTIAGGILQVGSGGTTGTLGSGSVVDNSILQFHRSDAYTVANAISGSGAIYVKPGGDLTLSGSVGCNTLRFHEAGDRTVRLTGSAANALAAVTDSQDGHGTLVFAKNAGVNAFSGAVLDVGSGYASQFLLRLDNHEQIANTTRVAMYGWNGEYGGRSWFRLNGCNETIAGLTGGSSTSYVQNGAAGASVLTLAGSGTCSLTGAVNDGGTGPLSLVKSGAGTQTFTGDQIDYTGTTTVSAGRLLLLNNDDTWTSGLSVASGAVVEISRDNATSYEHRNAFTLGGTGTFEKSGDGLMDMNWDRGGTVAMGTGGLIRIKAGTLRLGYGSMSVWTNNNADLTVDAGATFDLWDNNNAGVFVDSLSGGGSIVRSAHGQSGSLTVGVDGGSGTFSGGIGNASGITHFIKQGGGTQTLTSTTGLSYTGTTTVSGGQLLINGSKSGTGAVTINTGGTLGGTGTIAGAITNNGTLAPGSNAVGNLTLTNTLTLAGGSKLAWEITNWTGAAGTGWDKLTANSLDLTATTANRITIRLAGLALANFTETSASFLLVQTTTGITGFSADKFTVDTSGLTTPQGAWAVRQSGNNLLLAYGSPQSDANGNGMLDAWETARFGNASPGSNLPGDDPDGDGLCNLLEYALDSNPTAAGASPIVWDRETLGDGKHLRLTVPKNPAATNLTYLVETCGALNDWSAVNTTVESDTASQLIVRDNFNSSTAPRRFIRLRVITQP